MIALGDNRILMEPPGSLRTTRGYIDTIRAIRYQIPANGHLRISDLVDPPHPY